MDWYRAKATVEVPITFPVKAGASNDEVHDAALAEVERAGHGQVVQIDQIEQTVDTSNQ